MDDEEIDEQQIEEEETESINEADYEEEQLWEYESEDSDVYTEYGDNDYSVEECDEYED